MLLEQKPHQFPTLLLQFPFQFAVADGCSLLGLQVSDNMLKMLSAEAAIEALTGDQAQPDAARLLVLAELLKIEGDGVDQLDPGKRRFLK